MTVPTIETESQARAFWAELDERTRLLLAKTAPAILEPWTRDSLSNRELWNREPVSVMANCYGEYEAFLERGAFSIETIGHYETLAAAKSACDAKLRELGFVLEDG